MEGWAILHGPVGPFRERGLRQTEIEHLHAGLGQHDVSGLEIAVNDALVVGLLECVGDLDSIAQHLFEGRENPRPRRSASVRPSRYSKTK